MSYPLKTRITFAVSLLVVSLMLLSSWLILTYFEDKFQQASLAHLADALAVTAKDFQEKLNHSQQVLESIATEIPDGFFDNKEQKQAFLERQSTGRLTFDNGVSLFSPEGRLEAMAPFQSDVMGMDFSFRAYYRVTADTLQPYISDPFRSRQAHNHPIIMLTEPIIDEHNNLRAILGGSIDLFGNNFLRHLLTGSIGEEGYFVLLDQTSTLIMHPEKDLILKGGRMILPAHIFDDLLSRSRGHVNKVDVAGEEMLTVFQHLTPIDWTLVALYPTREVYGPIREARIYFLGVLVVLTLLAVFVVRIMTDRLTAPLTRLTDKVRQLNEPDADFSLPAAGQFRELGDLAESIQTLMVDVSEKRRSMNDQILFLQNLMETIPSPVFYKSADFRYLGCNNMFEDVFGLPREEILGRKVTELMPDDWAELHNERDAELWEQGGQTSYEAEITAANGTKRNMIFYKKVFHLASGEAGGLIGTCLDITERKRHEQDLHQALEAAQAAGEKVNNILRSVSDGLIVTDGQNRIIHLNAVAEEIIDMSAEKLIGRRFSRLFGNPFIRENFRNFAARADPDLRRQDFVVPQDDDRPQRVIQARSALMRSDEGEPIGLVTILHDVTHERELDRIKSEFISTAAHELRTPITVILGYTELLLEAHEHGTFSQEQREKFLHDIFRMGDSLARLVDDLLNISRIEAGLPVPLVREPCCLADIAQDVIQRYQNHCENHQFVLQSGDVDQVYADVNKLVQILENLISNAVKYSPQGGTVKISINDVDDKVQVIVEDEGVGMSTYQVERIFDKFYRADSSNTSIGGLGIGMSIVKTIIEEHDGNIRVESDQGIGTRVFFTVPKWQEETADLSA